jgi:hypothetical protein
MGASGSSSPAARTTPGQRRHHVDRHRGDDDDHHGDARQCGQHGLGVALPSGKAVAATAMRTNSETSEFSACVDTP